MIADDSVSGAGTSRTVAPDTGALRNLQQAQPARRDSPTSTVVTAEIPAVPAGPDYGVLLPDGSIWYPGSRKRLPAPLVLRVVVWTLGFLALLAGAGDFIIHTHPSWVDPMRRMVSVGALGLPASTAKTGTSTGVSSSSHGLSLSLASPQPAGLPAYTTAYKVTGTSSYTISISISSSGPCWTEATPIVNGALSTGAPLLSETLQAGETKSVHAVGPVAVEVAASGATVKVTSRHKVLGTVNPPTRVPWNFWFEPTSS